MASVNQKKKSSRHGEQHRRDGETGMSSATKRHFDNVRRKMRAFVDQHYRQELDAEHFASPSKALHHAHPLPPPPPPMFLDHNQMPKQPSHHRTPIPARKQFLTPAPVRKQVPQHLMFGTPQMARRVGK